MSHEIRADYSLVLMFPPSVEEWVGPDHPARFIRDLVDVMNLESMGFHVLCADTGRPRYAVDHLLKVRLYGYFNRIRSTRKLERACREHMGLIWLTGMNAPDHNALWRFWRDNKKPLRKVLRQSVRVALDSDLLGLALHALDGTKIMAASSGRKVWHKEDLQKRLKELDAAIDEVMKQVETSEGEESGTYRLPEELRDKRKRKEQIEAALKKLEEFDQDHLHPQETDARLMKHRKGVELSYNAQGVADDKSKLVVEAEVVNDESDSGQLVPMLDRVQESLGRVADENLADGGYTNADQIGLAEKRQYPILTGRGPNDPSPKADPAKSRFHTSRFVYEAEADRCVCPEGGVLTYERTKAARRNRYEVRVYRCRCFKECPCRAECTKDRRGRMMEIGPNHEAVVRARVKRNNPENQKILKRRSGIIEPVFARVKKHMEFLRRTVRGLENARTQWSLVCTSINLRKLHRHWVEGSLVLATH
jgi:transposase